MPSCELQDRDVEGAAAEIVDGDDAFLALVEAVGERRRSGLVDQPQHFESGEPPGVAGGLALGVVEVGGDGDDGFLDWLAQRGFGVPFQLAEDECGDLGRREGLVAELDADYRFAVFGDVEREELQLFGDVGHAVTHQALDGVDGAVGVIDQFPAGRVADDDLAFGPTETTLGTSLSPSSPTITSGAVRFIHATRLLVVPRSMPTTVP